MQQAARVSDDTGFMYLGVLVEFGETGQIFTRPKDEMDGGLYYREVWVRLINWQFIKLLNFIISSKL